jgi:hypothetical protein
VKTLENIAHWAFAIFMAMIAYIASLLLFTFLILKLEGLQIGVPLPPDFHSRISPMTLTVIAYCALFFPLMAAAFFGAITAPNSQRRMALVIFPALVFFVVNLVSYFGRRNFNFDIIWLLQSGASCAVVGVFLYFKWNRQKSKRARTG